MTDRLLAHDASAHSTRACRCGSRMLISASSGRIGAWRCPGWGRSGRR